MDWQYFWVGLSLVLVIEGILPFLNPGSWRKAMQSALELDDRTLRMLGLASMFSGLILLYWLR